MYTLKSSKLRMEFSDTGNLERFCNLLTGFSHCCRDGGFAICTPERIWRPSDFNGTVVRHASDRLELLYTGEFGQVEAMWTLGKDSHFAEGRLTLRPGNHIDLQHVTLFDFTMQPEREATVLSEYRYIDYATFDEMPNHQIWNCYREQDTEPSRLCFGRNSEGGFFIGLEAVFDRSEISHDHIRLTIRPMMHLKAGEFLTCEAAFIGVYADTPLEGRWREEWQQAVDRGVFSADYFKGGILNNELVQLSSAGGSSTPNPWKQPAERRPTIAESRAVSAMVQEILGSPRFGIMALACGWHCDMSQEEYTPETLRHDLHALDLFKECSMDGLWDPHPWGGETAKLNALREGDHYTIGELPRQMAEYAKKQGLLLGFWPTFNKTHPWRPTGIPFRPDRPDWERKIIPCENPNPNYENFRTQSGNCLGAYGFVDWLSGIYRDAMDTGYYGAFILDGDYWGTGAYSSTTIPVQCASAEHRHLQDDSEYVCQLASRQLITGIRDRYPDTYIAMCRPAMDHGIWALRDCDFCFTLIEAGSGEDNLLAGNAIRTSSRIRVHQHFIPHWLDSALLFPSHYHPQIHPKWPHEHMDFVLLSSIACTPNLLFYLPTAHDEDFPEADRSRIKYWLDWARANERYLMVRHDFPAWPSAEHPDGYAHLVDGDGYIFWFNSSGKDQEAQFRLDAEEAGFTGKSGARIQEVYPSAGEVRDFETGASVNWRIPAGSALILSVKGNK